MVNSPVKLEAAKQLSLIVLILEFQAIVQPVPSLPLCVKAAA
jgi:hypothetical protein